MENYPPGLGSLRFVYAAVSVPMDGDDMRTGRFDLYQYEIPSGKAKRLTGPDIAHQTRFGNVVTHNVHLSPDGKHLVFEANLPNEPVDLDQFQGANVLQVHLWHMGLGSGTIRRFDTDSGYVGYPFQDWSPDGRYYVARRQRGFNDPGGIQPEFAWLMWDTGTWRPVPITKRLAREKDVWLRPFYGYEAYVSASPDSTRTATVKTLATGKEPVASIQVRVAQTGQVALSRPMPHAVNPVFWSRDSRRLIVLTQRPDGPARQGFDWVLSVLDAQTGKPLHEQALGHRSRMWDYFQAPNWSRNGRWLMGLSREEDGYDLVMWDSTTYDVRVLPGPPGLPSPDSTTDWVSGIDWVESPAR